MSLKGVCQDWYWCNHPQRPLACKDNLGGQVLIHTLSELEQCRVNQLVQGLTLQRRIQTRVLLIKSQKQGFMQDQIIASHTCFSGHIDVNCLQGID